MALTAGHNHCHQISGVAGATALPGRSGKVRGDSLNQTRVGVRGDQPYPRKSSGHQVGEQPVPGRRALGGGYPQAQDLAMSISVDPGSGQDHRTDDTNAASNQQPTREAQQATGVAEPAERYSRLSDEGSRMGNQHDACIYSDSKQQDTHNQAAGLRCGQALSM